jgi:hypothetical protein
VRARLQGGRDQAGLVVPVLCSFYVSLQSQPPACPEGGRRKSLTFRECGMSSPSVVIHCRTKPPSNNEYLDPSIKRKR